MNKFLLSWRPLLLAFFFASFAQASYAQDFQRRDIVFTSAGVKCAAWYYVPSGMKSGEKRPAIVMAHGYSAVKEMYLDSFAEKFAKAGFVVTVFDYRFFGGSEGEPRQYISWYEQIEDYRNAISWTALQPEVDPQRVGIWGTSLSGAHVLYLAAFDRRVKAVVSQVFAGEVWPTYFGGMNAEQREGFFAWLAQERTERYAGGKRGYIPVVTEDGKGGALPWKEAADWFLTTGKTRAPSWRNEVAIESVEKQMTYDATRYIHLISPTPLLMVIASEDIVTPTELEKKDFERALEPKKLVVVQGRHFDAYNGPKHEEFARPQVEWFKQWLMR